MQRKIFRFFSGGSPHHLSKNCENFLSILRFSRGKKYFFQSCSKWCQKLKKNRLYFSIPAGGGGGPDPGMYFYIQFFFFLDCILPLLEWCPASVCDDRVLPRSFEQIWANLNDVITVHYYFPPPTQCPVSLGYKYIPQMINIRDGSVIVYIIPTTYIIHIFNYAAKLFL